jgi:hypothetical protein
MINLSGINENYNIGGICLPEKINDIKINALIKDIETTGSVSFQSQEEFLL